MLWSCWERWPGERRHPDHRKHHALGLGRLPQGQEEQIFNQLYVSGTLVGTMVRSQRSISLSSGEAELGQRHMRGHEFIGDCTTVKMRSRSDRAACRGVCNRLGCRRIRNLHAGLLWVQAIVQSKELEVGIIPRVDNSSDLGTKPLGVEHESRNSFS